MRTARIIRVILSIFIYALSISMSITSILAGYSAISILTTPGNINVPSGPVVSNMDLFRYSAYGEENFYTSIPFNYTNAGYFDLTDVYVNISIKFSYLDFITHQNQTIKLFTREDRYPDRNRRETYAGWFNVSTDAFNYDQIPSDIFYRIDISRDPVVEYFMDASFSAKYGMGLYAFKATINNIPLGSTQAEDLPAAVLIEIAKATGQTL